MSSNGESSASASVSGSPAVPKVGGVRCYWALLKPQYPSPDIPGSKLELVFVNPDPVLSVHLAKQKMSLLGRGLIEFIHPAEREQARRDLASAISTDDLQGSVTRVRFARLSRLRLILGCKPDEIEYFENHEKVVEDDEWMVLDLVLNWVADGLLLAFFHAIRDMDPIANNDPNRISEGWSNFCGTANMAEEQIDAMYETISSLIAPPALTRFPPTRVFQLHTTPYAPTRPGQLVFSWPPARPPGQSPRQDGLYDAEEYADLMKGVNMDPAQLPRAPDEVRTTCTTRFGATHGITSEGVYRHTTKLFELSPRSAEASYGLLPNQPSAEWMNNHHRTSLSSHIDNAPLPDVPLPSSIPLASPTHHPAIQNHHSPRTQPHHHLNQHPHHSAHNAHHAHPHIPSHQAPQSQEWRSPAGGPPEYAQHHQQSAHPSSHHVHSAQPLQSEYYEDRYSSQHTPGGPGGNMSSAGGKDQHNPYPTPSTGGYDSYSGGNSPPISLHHQQQQHQQQHHSTGPGGISRPLVRPPGNVDCCRMCGIRESPEWRRNESGLKDLCNACGLRLARQVAKREGRQKPRKKKERSA